MDPVTQGIVGAALPQATLNNKHKGRQYIWAGICGLLGGMAPDLDTLIRSDHDPLLYLEYHRHFSHALLFIPIGGLIIASLFYVLIGMRFSLSFRQTYIYCTLGYASHWILDAMTSYGTQLFWPLSNLRVAFNSISVIDPIFTLPIIILVCATIWRKSALYARLALIWAVAYLGLAVFQHISALQIGKEIAANRGHTPQELAVKPSFANILLWKVIYRHEERYYVDAVRVNWREKIYEGSSIAALDVKRDFPWLKSDSQQAKDVKRFHWFSNGYVAKAPGDENRIIDLRYSQLPNEITGLWSITLSPDAGPEAHAGYKTHRDSTKEQGKKLLEMIFE